MRCSTVKMMVSLSLKASQKILVSHIVPLIEKYKDSQNSKFRMVYLHYIKDIGNIFSK